VVFAADHCPHQAGKYQERNMSMKPVLAILALVVASGSAPVLAADNNFYGVASIGWSNLNADSSSVDAFNARTGFTSSSTATSSGNAGGKVQLGYNLGKTFALEGGFTYLGKADFTSVTNAGAFGGSKEAGLFNLDLVAKFPMTEQFSFLARFGGYYWKTKNEMPNATTLGTTSVNDNGFDFKAGAGVQYEFNPRFSMRGEFERFNGVGKTETSGDSKVNLLTVGAVLKF
jgi:OOP family OmpA-OmpF porin